MCKGFKKILMNNFLLKKINIGFGNKCQTWSEIYRPGSKRAYSIIQFTLRKKCEKLNVNVSSQTAYIYTVEEMCCKKHIAYFFSYTLWLTIYLKIIQMMNALQFTLPSL